MGDRNVDRRTLLARAGVVGSILALAGCTSDSADDGGGDGDGSGDSNGDGTDDGSGGPEETAFNPADCTPEMVSSDVESDTTWSPDECQRMAIDGNVRVTGGATLSIEPGVEVVGKSGARITVTSGSTLEARGEATNPVWFYGETDAKGYWEGIRFRSATDNVLDNAVLRNGGQNDWANLYLTDSAQVSITNTLFEQCSTSGLVADSGTTLTDFSNNAFRDNEFAAMELPTTHAGMIDSGSVYAGGNGDDVVHLFAQDVEADATWAALDVPYRFAGSNHRLNAAITVDPGASFVFQSGARLAVRSSGSLTAEGANDARISFEGETATAGFWEGIRLRSNDPNNSFDYVDLAHGGQNDWANLYLTDSAQVSITNSRSSQCATSGLVADGGTTLSEFANNTFADNEFAAVEIPTHEVAAVDADSTYAGDNGDDVVHVFAQDVEDDATWAALDVPYRFAGSNHRLLAAVTVNPDASFVFESGARLTVKSGGSLTAEGGSDATITFEGATDTQGFWEGIRLRSNDPNNSLDNVEIANGGQNDWANLYLTDDSRASVTNSTLRLSATYGIVVTSGASLDASHNTFKNNAEGAIDNRND